MPRGCGRVPCWGLALSTRDLLRFQLPISILGIHFGSGIFLGALAVSSCQLRLCGSLCPASGYQQGFQGMLGLREHPMAGGWHPLCMKKGVWCELPQVNKHVLGASLTKLWAVPPKPVNEEAKQESLSDPQRWEWLGRGISLGGKWKLPAALDLNASRSGSKSHLCHSGKLLIESALVGEDKAKGVLLPLLLFLIY